ILPGDRLVGPGDTIPTPGDPIPGPGGPGVAFLAPGSATTRSYSPGGVLALGGWRASPTSSNRIVKPARPYRTPEVDEHCTIGELGELGAIAEPQRTRRHQ